MVVAKQLCLKLYFWGQYLQYNGSVADLVPTCVVDWIGFFLVLRTTPHSSSNCYGVASVLWVEDLEAAIPK